MKRSKESMLAEMIRLNEENSLNMDNKRLSLSLFKNSTKTGNKIFLEIPVSLLKVDTDMYQRTLQRHVRVIARNWNDDKCDPLMVNYRSDGFFYVIDGQHRLEAAKMRGIESLVCIVFVGLSIKEEADLFTEQNEGTKKLSPFDTFKANLCRGNETDVLINNICHKYGIEVKRENRVRTLKSVTVARKIVQSGGKESLEWIFSMFKKSGWDNFKETYTADLIYGMYTTKVNNTECLKTAEKALVNFFIKSSPREVAALGNSEYPQYGRQVRINMILDEIIREGTKQSSNRKIKSIA